jgi:nucleotide-binding universal stress UspA family protein
MRRDGIMFDRILVPLDGSEIAESILPYVEDLASTHKSKIVLLRVALAHTLPGQDEIKAEVEVVREAEEYLKGVEERLRKKGFDVESHVRYGKGAEEIVDFCHEPEIGAVAMFTHGRSGVGRWLMGSVAEKVVRHCPLPVVLFRPEDK